MEAIGATIDLGTAGWHRAARLILLVEACARVARLPVVDALLNQHLAHRQAAAMLLQPLAIVAGAHLRFCWVGLVRVGRLAACSIGVAAILAQVLLGLPIFQTLVSHLRALRFSSRRHPLSAA